MIRTIPLGIVALLVVAAFILGQITGFAIHGDAAPSVTCTPVADDTDQPLAPGQTACGGLI